MKRLSGSNSKIKHEHISYSEFGHGVLATWDLPIFHSVGKFWCVLGADPIKNKDANLDYFDKIIYFIKN